ncbi:MAG: hypothetical protein KJ600_00060 [Nanoarchaeota archaeon]|nr:hypothetical protein [Nanoarchaeota archaeon]
MKLREIFARESYTAIETVQTGVTGGGSSSSNFPVYEEIPVTRTKFRHPKVAWTIILGTVAIGGYFTTPKYLEHRRVQTEIKQIEDLRNFRQALRNDPNPKISENDIFIEKSLRELYGDHVYEKMLKKDLERN